MKHGSPAARPLALLGSIAALLLVPSVASASLITVNDPGDPSGTGCTLRAAINSANINTAAGNCGSGTAGADVIDFSLPPSSTISLTAPLPVLAEDLGIAGPGPGQLTITGNDLVRPLHIDVDVPVDISGLTITHGCGGVCSSEGGGIVNQGMLTLTDVAVTRSMAASTAAAMSNFAEGGGIQNEGGSTLSLLRTSVSGNTVMASGATSQNGANGGGIMNRGTLLIDRSTVSGNHAIGVATGGATTNVAGGGLDTNAPVAAARSTISGNTVSGTGGVTNSSSGGGIAAYNSAAVTISLDRTTVNGNSVVGDVGNAQAGGVQGFGSNFTVSSSTISGNSALSSANLTLGATSKTFKNTIISNPLGGGLNCSSATATSLGFNIEDGSSCGFGQSTDHPDTDPMLAALADNGGPTMTMALLAGSPAIDQGLSTPLETTDQRVLARPSDFTSIPNASGGDGTDIGAFEVQLPVVPPSATPTTTTPSTTSPATPKKCKKGRKLKKGKCVKKKRKH
jgi:hypothetical protein